MSAIEGGKFACEECGKRYTWKPQLAGKRARCGCGALMTVPQPEAAKPQAEADDLYDIADAPAAEYTPPPLSAPVVATAPSAAKSPIGYRTPAKDKDRFSFDAMTHPPRDLYIPSGLLIAGFVGIFAWAMFALDAGAFGVMVVSAIMTFTTIVKTIILILAAMSFAPMLGISFGDFRTAVLKFAAIIVFVDAVGFWYDELLQLSGGISGSGRRARGTTYLWILLAAGLISAMCFYLFDMDSEETGYFAIPFAIASMVIGFFLKLGAIAIIASLLASSAAPPPAPVGAPTPKTGAGGTGAGAAPAPPPPPVTPIVETELDREIDQKTERGFGLVKQARDFNETRRRDKELQPFIQLTGDMEVSGARAVYYEFGGAFDVPAVVYIKLSIDKESRRRCFDIYRRFCEQNKIPLDPAMAKDTRQKYIVIEVPKR